MLKKFIVITASFGAIFLSSCTSDTPANQASPSNAANAANKSGAAPALSPTATLKALSEASNIKDIAAIKTHLSKGTLALLETGAKEQKKTVDELLAEEDGAPFPKLPELGPENVTEDTATLDVKNADTGEFEKLPFVKEDGQWKVAIDVYLKNLDAEVQGGQPKR